MEGSTLSKWKLQCRTVKWPDEFTGIMVEKTFVDPQLARDFLDLNYEKNRWINPIRIEMYANQMKAGEWLFNGMPIIFDSTGHLIDGQHRLKAIIKSGKGIWTIVTWGVQTEVYRTIDRNKPRTPANDLDFEGEKNSLDLVALMKWLHRWENRTSKNGGKNIPIRLYPGLTSFQYKKILVANPQIKESVEFVAKMRSKFVGICAPMLAAFTHFEFSKKDSTQADDFIRSLASGANLGPDDPQFVAREQMRTMRTKTQPYPDYEYLAIVIMAWNQLKGGTQFFIEKDRNPRYQWKKNNGKFPDVR